MTAVKQLTCQSKKLALDKLMVVTDITKRTKEQVDAASRDGSFVCGFNLEGARWGDGSIEESKPKEVYCPMPVINCRAELAADVDWKKKYRCPAYQIAVRRPYYVFDAQLATAKHPAAKWILAGVAMILDVGV